MSYRLPRVHSQDAKDGAEGQIALGSAIAPIPLPSVRGLHRYRQLARLIAATDAECLVAALLLSYFLRFGWGSIPRTYAVLITIAPLLWIGVFRGYALYDTQRLSAWEEFRRIIGASSLGVVLIALVSFWVKLSLSRAWVAYTLILGLTFILTSRRLWRAYIDRLKREGRLALRTVIVGAGPRATELARHLQESKSGYQTLGYVTPRTFDAHSSDLALLGEVADLDRLLEHHRVDCVFIASGQLAESEMLAVMQAARQRSVEVRVSAGLPEILSPRLSVQPVGKLMTLSLRPVRLTGTQAVVKRVFDLAISATLVLLLAPFLAIIAMAVKLTSAGPVFFKQERVTKGGRVFQMLKFRTMRVNGDQILRELQIDPTVPFFKMEHDPRVTTLGRILRRLSLDELPQLMNVLRGEMSLVGPRPLPLDQVQANLSSLAPRHEVSAGMTGWWQVSGRSDHEAEEAVHLDLFYIENWSLSLDMFILLKTLGAVLGGRGAY